MAEVSVLVGKRKEEGRKEFTGFWAAFEGEKVSSREDEDGRIYTLYSCGAYGFDAYRVHVEDECDPTDPTYELRPFNAERSVGRTGFDYSEPYDTEQLAYTYPAFLKDLEHLRVVNIDPR